LLRAKLDADLQRLATRLEEEDGEQAVIGETHLPKRGASQKGGLSDRGVLDAKETKVVEKRSRHF